jgi:hypothetical protein
MRREGPQARGAESNKWRRVTVNMFKTLVYDSIILRRSL